MHEWSVSLLNSPTRWVLEAQNLLANVLNSLHVLPLRDVRISIYKHWQVSSCVCFRREKSQPFHSFLCLIVLWWFVSMMSAWIMEVLKAYENYCLSIYILSLSLSVNSVCICRCGYWMSKCTGICVYVCGFVCGGVGCLCTGRPEINIGCLLQCLQPYSQR